MSNRYSQAIKGLHSIAMATGPDLSFIRKIAPTLALWQRRREFRAELRRLLKVGPHMVADIGLSQRAAHIQSETPCWLA